MMFFNLLSSSLFMQSDLIIEQQTMIQNLKDYIQQNAGSLSEFAKTHNLYLSNLSNVLNGKRKFSTKLARELEDKLKLETGYFTKSKENNIKIPFNTINSEINELIFDNAFFSIQKALLGQNKVFNFLFAIHPSINFDRAAMQKRINKSQILIFDSQMIELIEDKIYLLRYKNQIVLRKYVNNAEKSGFFIADLSEIYSPIKHSEDVEILGRLLYTVDIEEK